MDVDTAPYDLIDPIDADLKSVDRYLLVDRGALVVGAIMFVAFVVVAALALRDLWPPRAIDATDDRSVGRQL